MAYYDLLPKFHYIEPNNLKGLQPGFVVAQMEVAESAKASLTVAGSDGKLVANGAICTISKDGIKVWTEGNPAFIVYNEPLNTIRDGDCFYATEIENENLRLVQLIPGDEWMAEGLASDYPGLEALITAGLAVEVKEGDGQSQDDWFSCTTMANGDAGKHYLFIGK